MKRYISFAGSTLTVSSLYDAISYVLHQPINVTYETKDAARKSEKAQSGSEYEPSPSLDSFRRYLGLGVYVLDPRDRNEFGKEIASSGKEHIAELRPKSWTKVVHEHFTKEKGQTAKVQQE